MSGGMAPRRLLLTSCGLISQPLRDEFFRILGRSPGEATVWYIPTAYKRDQPDPEKAMREAHGMAGSLQRNLGLGRVEVIDLEDHSDLRSAVLGLGRVDMIYAEFGNTYALRHHLRAQGADALVRELMDQGAIYVGASAGSICAGRTVQTAFWKNWDDPTAQGTIRVDWRDEELGRGLDLAGGRSIFPHANKGTEYGSREWQDGRARAFGHDNHEVVRLHDGAGILLDGDDAYFIDECGCRRVSA